MTWPGDWLVFSWSATIGCALGILSANCLFLLWLRWRILRENKILRRELDVLLMERIYYLRTDDAVEPSEVPDDDDGDWTIEDVANWLGVLANRNQHPDAMKNFRRAHKVVRRLCGRIAAPEIRE